MTKKLSIRELEKMPGYQFSVNQKIKHIQNTTAAKILLGGTPDPTYLTTTEYFNKLEPRSRPVKCKN